jgi:glycosidase
MNFKESALGQVRPASLHDQVRLPHRQAYFPSPADWRDQVLYFLLVDRFSDGREDTRPLLDRTDRASARPAGPNGEPWRWDHWAQSGSDRWQGGTLSGVWSKLGYLHELGVTTIWLSPVFKQRGHLNTFHGYGIQDFLEVDPRFGTRQDLVELVEAAHALDMRIVLDIIFNHSGSNWAYPGDVDKAPYLPYPGRHPFGHWRDGDGQATESIAEPGDGVWPIELQDTERYTRAGSGGLGNGDINDPYAEYRRSDFENLRDFDLDAPGTLSDLAACYKYWIALTDCDGFRIDTLKHVSLEQARNFCGAIKEFADNLDKRNFLLIGEVAGGDFQQDRYLDVLRRNLDAALDIGGMRLVLNQVAKGLETPSDYFNGFDPGDAEMGSHRNLGDRHVSILDDHDHVFGPKIRFAAEAATAQQVVAGVALQLFTLGIPCLYYGTEQALSGPESKERQWLPGWKSHDRYLREAMFGPRHPRRSGKAGMPGEADTLDTELPGFGPFGTAGQHIFDRNDRVYRRVAAMGQLRAEFPALRHGRQYQRPTAFLGRGFDFQGAGELFAWSRILDGEEVLCALNGHGTQFRGADIVVDANLSQEHMTVVLNTAEAADPATYNGTHRVGSTVPVHRSWDGPSHIELQHVAPSELIVLSNRPLAEPGGVIGSA